MVKGPAKLGIDICDEQVLIERDRLGGKLAPGGEDKASANAHLRAIGPEGAHAHNPGTRCLRIVQETAIRDCRAHARRGVVHDKPTAVEVHQHVQVKVEGIEVVKVVKGEGESKANAIDIEDGKVLRGASVTLFSTWGMASLAVHNIRAHERREFERRNLAVVHEDRLGRRRAIGIRENRHDAGAGNLVGKLDQRLRKVEQEPLLTGLIDGPYAHEGCRRKHHELGSLVGRSSSELDHPLSGALELPCRGPHLGNRDLHAWTFPYLP